MSRKITITRTLELPDFLIEEIRSNGPFRGLITAMRDVRSILRVHMPAFAGLADVRQITETLVSDGIIELSDHQHRTRGAIDGLGHLPEDEIAHICAKSPFASPTHIFSMLHRCVSVAHQTDIPVWALRAAAQQMIDEGLIEVAGMDPRVSTDPDSNPALTEMIGNSRKIFGPV